MSEQRIEPGAFESTVSAGAGASMTTDEYLRELLISQKKEERMSRVRMTVQIISSSIMLILAAMVFFRVVPMITPVITQIDDLAVMVSDLADNTNTLVKELNAADLGGTVEEARDAIASASASMEVAVDSISEVDFETLNKSVEALNVVVSALASIFR